MAAGASTGLYRRVDYFIGIILIRSGCSLFTWIAIIFLFWCLDRSSHPRCNKTKEIISHTGITTCHLYNAPFVGQWFSQKHDPKEWLILPVLPSVCVPVSREPFCFLVTRLQPALLLLGHCIFGANTTVLCCMGRDIQKIKLTAFN